MISRLHTAADLGYARSEYLRTFSQQSSACHHLTAAVYLVAYKYTERDLQSTAVVCMIVLYSSETHIKRVVPDGGSRRI